MKSTPAMVNLSWQSQKILQRHTADRKSFDFTKKLFGLNPKTLENYGKKMSLLPFFVSSRCTEEEEKKRDPRCNGDDGGTGTRRPSRLQ
jgi:hypothetical protein